MNVIFGASGHAKEIFGMVQALQLPTISYFVDKDPECRSLLGIRVICEQEFFEMERASVTSIYMGIGSGKIRQRIYQKLISIGFEDRQFPSLVHPSVITYSDSTVQLGIGVVIGAGCIMTTEINIGNFVHININSTVSHECSINSFSTISPGCSISGNVNIGKNVFLGAQSVLVDNVSIAENVVIGAGAVVVKNIDKPGTYVGVPARKNDSDG